MSTAASWRWRRPTAKLSDVEEANAPDWRRLVGRSRYRPEHVLLLGGGEASVRRPCRRDHQKRCPGAGVIGSVHRRSILSPVSWFWPATTETTIALPDPRVADRFYTMSAVYGGKLPVVLLVDADCQMRKLSFFGPDDGKCGARSRPLVSLLLQPTENIPPCAHQPRGASDLDRGFLRHRLVQRKGSRGGRATTQVQMNRTAPTRLMPSAFSRLLKFAPATR